MANLDTFPVRKDNISFSYISTTNKSGTVGRKAAICHHEEFLNWLKERGFKDEEFSLGFCRRDSYRCMVLSNNGTIGTSKSGNNGLFLQIKKSWFKELPNKLRTFGESTPHLVWYDAYEKKIFLAFPQHPPAVRKPGRIRKVVEEKEEDKKETSSHAFHSAKQVLKEIENKIHNKQRQYEMLVKETEGLIKETALLRDEIDFLKGLANGLKKL